MVMSQQTVDGLIAGFTTIAPSDLPTVCPLADNVLNLGEAIEHKSNILYSFLVFRGALQQYVAADSCRTKFGIFSPAKQISLSLSLFASVSV